MMPTTAFFLSCLVTVSTLAMELPSCPADGIAAKKGDSPKLVFRASEKASVLLCGHREEGRYSEFDLFTVKPDKTSEVITQVGATENYQVIVLQEKLLLKELEWYHGQWTPFFTSEVTCAEDKCVRSEPQCVFKKKKIKKLTAVKQIEQDIKDGTPTEDKTIMSLVDEALSGNQKSRELLNKAPEGLKIDGGAAEEYNSGKKLFSRLQETKCI